MIAFILCLFLYPFSLYSQEPEIKYGSNAPYSIGLMVGSSTIFNQSMVDVIPGSTDCGMYQQGTSQGMSLGLVGEYTIIPSFLSVSSRFYLAQHPASLQSDDCRFLVYNQNNQVYDTLKIRNQYTISLDRIMIDIGASFYPIPNIPLFARIGASYGLGITENTYERTQTIISPDYAFFPTTRTKTQKIESGNVNSNSLIGANASLGYYLHVSPTIALMPEIAYMQSFNSLLKDQEWKSSSLDFRLALCYRPLEELIEPPPPEEPKEIPPPPALAIVNPVTFSQLEAPNLELQQTVITQTFPLLPYIFFDSLSTQPRSIKTDIDPLYDEQKVSSNTLETYNHILGIIANRIKSSPDAKLILTGSTDGKEKSTSQSRKSLAMQRAQSIKNILVDTWNINPDNIILKSRDLPEILSNTDYIEGDAENRRVEIESDQPNILRPVIYSKFNEFVPLHKTLTLGMQSDSSVNIQKWNIDIKHHGIVLRTLEGMGTPPKEYAITIDSNIISGIGNQVLDKQDSVDITLNSQLANGDVFTMTTSKPILKTNNTYELSRLSLIVFEYDESSLSEKNRTMMNQFLQQEIRTDSKVTIVGSTDKLGERDYNLELSESRAKTVESFMRKSQQNINITSVKGIGVSTKLFDNALPEGRYYCRTVSIEVENPIQDLIGK